MPPEEDDMTMIIEAVPSADTAGHDAAVNEYFRPQRERRPASVRAVQRWADLITGTLLLLAAGVVGVAVFGAPLPWYAVKVAELGLALTGFSYGAALAVAAWRSR